MKPQQLQHEWSSIALYDKAQLYAEERSSFASDDWKSALWSSLVLELLSRAALSNFSPTLLADSKANWNNLLFSLGHEPKIKAFSPRAISIAEVFKRLQELISDFTPELERFCVSHLSKRNTELHSGATPFVGISESSWLPTYYQVCEVLLASLEKDLFDFLDEKEATLAAAMINAAKDDSAKSVQQSIKAHKLVWDNSDSKERERRVLQSTTWATRQTGHRVPCPACGCDAILFGKPIASPAKEISEDKVTETQEFLPSRFECVGCSLKISGYSRLSAAGLGDRFNAKFTYDVFEHFVPEDYYGEYEPDFND